MQSSYRLNANELDGEFIAGLKATYKDKDIEIIVYEVNIENKSNLVEVELED